MTPSAQTLSPQRRRMFDGMRSEGKDPKQINAEGSFVWSKDAVLSLVGHPLDVDLRRRGAVDRG